MLPGESSGIRREPSGEVSPKPDEASRGIPFAHLTCQYVALGEAALFVTTTIAPASSIGAVSKTSLSQTFNPPQCAVR